jgi:hypothetical protein
MRCQCIKKNLKQCNYQSNPDSQFCGVHKTCKTIMENEPESEPKPNAFDVLPKELIEHILSFANPQDLHQIKQVDLRLWNEVQDIYQSKVRKARKLLGVHAEPFTDAQLMSRVKYLSDGQYDTTGIQITVVPSGGSRWVKGARSVNLLHTITHVGYQSINRDGHWAIDLAHNVHSSDYYNDITETWINNKSYYRPDGPAYILSDSSNGRIISEDWCTLSTNMWYHRLDGPARTEWDRSTGRKLRELWYTNGMIDKITYYDRGRYVGKTGRKTEELWYNNEIPSHIDQNHYHREDGPAVTRWKDGRKTEELWYEKVGKGFLAHSQYHREDGPAVTRWDKDGRITKQWYRHGKGYLATSEYPGLNQVATESDLRGNRA